MIYLNNFSTGFPKPGCVLKGINDYLISPPDDSLRNGGGESIVNSCRQKVAKFFKCSSEYQVILTSGATEALNLVLFGLSGMSHVISTVTEHNSVIRPLKFLEKEKQLTISWIKCDLYGYVDLDELKANVRSNTTAIVINHCSNVTGAIQDLSEISKIAQDKGVLLIVDASQSAGVIEIDLSVTKVDALIFTGHKNLFSTSGVGGVVIHKNLSLKPLLHGGTGVKSSLLYQPEEFPYKYEAGTMNDVGFVALNYGLDYIDSIGLDNIFNQKKSLVDYALPQLKSILDIQVLESETTRKSIPVINIQHNEFSVEDLSYILHHSYGFITRSGLHCAPLIHKYIGTDPEGTIRLSFSHLNVKSDIDQLIKALTEISKS